MVTARRIRRIDAMRAAAEHARRLGVNPVVTTPHPPDEHSDRPHYHVVVRGRAIPPPFPYDPEPSTQRVRYIVAYQAARDHGRRLGPNPRILPHPPDEHSSRPHLHAVVRGFVLPTPFPYDPEGEGEWEQLAELEDFAESSRARWGGGAIAPGERQVDRLVQRVGSAVAAPTADDGLYEDEGEAVSSQARTTVLYHYAPAALPGRMIPAGSLWTEFNNVNANVDARYVHALLAPYWRDIGVDPRTVPPPTVRYRMDVPERDLGDTRLFRRLRSIDLPGTEHHRVFRLLRARRLPPLARPFRL